MQGITFDYILLSVKNFYSFHILFFPKHSCRNQMISNSNHVPIQLYIHTLVSFISDQIRKNKKSGEEKLLFSHRLFQA